MFYISLSGKDPIYEQIKRQIHAFIEAGVLKPDDRLPSVRQLAQDNGINPNTVAKAYSELEEEGVVYNVPKKGVYVSNREIASKRETIVNVLKPLRERGYTKEELLDAVNTLYGGNQDA